MIKDLYRYLALCVLILSAIACSEDDTVTDDVVSEYEITYIPLINGLGDCSYTDSCYAAVYQSALQTKARLLVVAPDTVNHAIKPTQAIDAWFAQHEDPNMHRLLVLGDPYYADYLKQKDYHMTNQREVLIIDCRDREVDAYTIEMPLYGVCYLFGLIASHKEYFVDELLPEGFCNLPCVVYSANDVDVPLVEGTQGFVEGLAYRKGEVAITDAITHEKNQGFLNMHDVMKAAITYNGQHRFALPLVGGNCRALSICNYMSQYKPMVYAGVDISMTQQDPYQVCAFAKNFRKHVGSFIHAWRHGEARSLHQTFLLNQQGTNVSFGTLILNKTDRGLGPDYIEQLKKIAIEKETAYYEDKIQ